MSLIRLGIAFCIILGHFPQVFANEHDRNVHILNSIPIVNGFEEKPSSESGITEDLIEIFKRFANRNQNSDGTLNRGTHAKGTCFMGSTQVYTAQALQKSFNYSPELVSRIQQGLWASPGSYITTLRFANANGLGKVQDDRISDIRGFSFSIETPNNRVGYSGKNRQDFMMNSTPQFVNGHIREFSALVKLANNTEYYDFDFIPNPIILIRTLKELKAFQAMNGSGGHAASFATQRYWSNLPYTHGINQQVKRPRDIVKYKVTPCEGRTLEKLTHVEGLSSNYLQDEVSQRAASQGICMLLQVQIFDQKKLSQAVTNNQQKKWSNVDWMENGGVLWPESVLPFHTVAKIEIAKNQNQANLSESEIPCDQFYVNTRLHSHPDHQPIGSIARVRTLVEEVSRARRMAESP